MPDAERPGEFETIERLFRPLALEPYARGLLDDAAVLPARPGHDLILTKDTVVEGVHFLGDDPLDLVARKLLRVNLSDLAAKGAQPFGYLLSCAWSPRCGWSEREAFARGLAEDQRRFGVGLLGGDTVSTPGPLTLSATLIGYAPEGSAPSRAGARAGDLLVVSGTIGDGGLGLRAARSEEMGLSRAERDALAHRYRLPQPRLELAEAVRVFAHASADVSDGLVADAGRISAASGLRAVIDLDAMPLSAQARVWLYAQADPAGAAATLATAGDDYEILAALAPADLKPYCEACKAAGVPAALVGRLEAGEGVEARWRDQSVSLSRRGWTHG
ncbi:thiamine-phosphate kinase [Brevundimonas sp. 2R-24]|uniref:Thiamine-monophosphate kinase n=2 Tax=Peiella sedimenti TaxID=3061083 RepID=A0ABT8SM34_9CAUL|nr:thiamine-phosphate kinase [Caulobacteraceae bacterium XZ-24]